MPSSFNGRSKLPLLCGGAVAVLLSSVLGCADMPTAAAPPAPQPPPAGKRVIGQMVVNFNVTGPGEVRPSVYTPRATLPSNVRATISITAENDVTGIIGEFLPGAGSFTHGPPGNGGYRYLFGTMKVRNAGVKMSGDTVAYTTPRPNLTVVATATNMPGAIAGTPFANLAKYDGSAADQSIASGILPAGASLQTLTGGVTAHTPDVFQVFTESEIAGLGSDAFPYGYVVRHKTSTTSRTLAANPGPNDFDGFITFGLKIPLQAQPADDVYGFSMAFLVVDDSEVRVTQSMEEQDATAQAAFEARAAALTGITEVRVLEGGNYTGSVPVRYMCSVRIAGSAGSPTATLENTSVTGAFSSFSPNPYAAQGPAFLAQTGAITANFTGTRSGASATTFVVNGSQSGRAFLSSGTYTGNGTTALTTPAGNYFAGEEVEVSLTARFGCPARVARVRVASASSAGTFGTKTDFPAATTPLSAAAGDFDKDGDLDLVVVNNGSDNVSVLANNGSGSFGGATNVAVGAAPAAVAVGDVNGDGNLDLIVANNSPDNNLSVRLGNGSGGFTNGTSIPAVASPNAVALGDTDGDGRLDVVFTNLGTNQVSVRLGVGNGTFTTLTNAAVGTAPAAVALGDVNGDGRLDIVTANANDNKVSVLLGTTGGFGAKTDFSVGTNPNAVALGDVNGDGKLDLVTANQGTSPGTDGVSLLIGNGSGGFGSATTLTAGLVPYSIALVDVNGDGKLDIVVANVAEDKASVRLGDGVGGFGSATSFAVGVQPLAIVLGDLNGDSKLDIITANTGANNASVLLQP